MSVNATSGATVVVVWNGDEAQLPPEPYPPPDPSPKPRPRPRPNGMCPLLGGSASIWRAGILLAKAEKEPKQKEPKERELKYEDSEEVKEPPDPSPPPWLRKIQEDYSKQWDEKPRASIIGIVKL